LRELRVCFPVSRQFASPLVRPVPGRYNAHRRWANCRAMTILVVMALFIAGCSRNENPDGRIVINFWDFPHLPATNAHIEKTLSDFQAENPNTIVRYTRVPWQDGQQKIMLSVSSGKPPDICGQVNVSPHFITQDVLEPLNDYLRPELQDFHPAYLDAVTYKGRIYALPWYKACYVMLLNLDLFDRFGVGPPRDGRWTWDEFLATMKALTLFEDGNGKRHPGRKPASVAGSGTQYYGLVTNLGPAEYEAYNIIFNAGGRILRRSATGDIVSGVQSPEFIEGVRRLASLEFEYGVCAPGIGAMTQDQSWSMWRDSEVCAATIQGAWCITAIERTNMEIEALNQQKIAGGRTSEVKKPIRWMIAAPPSDDANTTPVLGSSGLGTYVIFKQSNAAKRDLCFKLINRLTSAEGQEVLRYENVYPSRISTGNLWRQDPALEKVFELFPEGVMLPLIPGIERVDRVLQQEIQKAVLRDRRTGGPQVTPEEAARAAEIKMQAILERARRRG
jgi:multiple sugar transport system substrate-binding protein